MSTEPVNLSDYDFIDFGASKGGCIEFAMDRLGGQRGLGIDINTNKAEEMRRNGYDCIEGDITKLALPGKSVRFVTMSHILEHLPDLLSVEEAIKSAAHVASDFLFIQGPFFDADEFLKKQGLRFFWSYWTGHICHLTTWQLKEILFNLGLPEHLIMVREVLMDSSDPAIHPLASPINQHEYIPEVHPEKSFITFSPPLYKEIVCYVRLRPLTNWDTIIKARKGCYLFEPKQP